MHQRLNTSKIATQIRRTGVRIFFFNITNDYDHEDLKKTFMSIQNAI